MIKEIKQALQDLAIPEKALFFPKFFKTGKGEYGEGDLFVGVKVPDQRAVAKEYYATISEQELSELLSSKYHEHRLTALLMLVLKFEKSKEEVEKKRWIDFYLNHLKFVNNWDLVDSTAYKILGRYSFEKNDSQLLEQLSDSEIMWHKRIAIVATMHYVKNGSYNLTKKLVLNNINHSHDLMHKANGWLLREIGCKNENELIDFLKIHYKIMPRTSLRYAIEKLDEDVRQGFLKGNI